MLASSYYFNILLMIPDCPEDLLLFNILILRTTSSFVINGAREQHERVVGYPQGNSAFSYFHIDPVMLVFSRHFDLSITSNTFAVFPDLFCDFEGIIILPDTDKLFILDTSIGFMHN